MSAARARFPTSARSTLRTSCISLVFVITTAYPQSRRRSRSLSATIQATWTSVVPFTTSLPLLVSDGCPGSIAMTTGSAAARSAVAQPDVTNAPSAISAQLLGADATLEIHDRFEPAIDHSPGIERHRLVHVFEDALVLHHFRVDTVAIRARLENDIGEEHGLVGLGLDHARKRHRALRFQVVTDAFTKLKCTELAPDFASLSRHVSVSR